VPNGHWGSASLEWSPDWPTRNRLLPHTCYCAKWTLGLCLLGMESWL